MDLGEHTPERVAEQLTTVISAEIDGAPVFSTETLIDFGAMLVLSRPLPEEAPEKAHSDARRLLQAFAQRVGFSPAASPKEVTAAIALHFQKHPLPPALEQQLGDLLRALLSGQVPSLGHQLQSLLGLESRRFEPPTTPKDGQVKAGPFARFQATAPSKKPGPPSEADLVRSKANESNS